MSNDTPRPERVTLTADECVALIREIPTDFPCLNDIPCEDATNPADRSESLAHHFDCPTLEAWAVVKRILAAREQALREEIAGRIEADCEAAEPPCYGCWNAARIARGGAR